MNREQLSPEQKRFRRNWLAEGAKGGAYDELQRRCGTDHVFGEFREECARCGSTRG